jgi:hypothetical protein
MLNDVFALFEDTCSRYETFSLCMPSFRLLAFSVSGRPFRSLRRFRSSNPWHYYIEEFESKVERYVTFPVVQNFQVDSYIINAENSIPWHNLTTFKVQLKGINDLYPILIQVPNVTDFSVVLHDAGSWQVGGAD